MIDTGTIFGGSFFQWLVQTSLQASLLIILILSLQKILGNQLGVRCRYSLWLVLLVRMAMPWAPQSSISLYNLLPPSLTNQGGSVIAASEPKNIHSVVRRSQQKIASSNTADEKVEATLFNDINSNNHYWPVGRMVRGLPLLWLLGTCVLAGYTFAASWRLWRIVQDGQLVTNRETLDVLNACKRLIGTRTDVDVIATDRLGSPALFGLLHPRLLLPGQTLAVATPTELRHIFLHELAHLKRHDILINYITGCLHALHWFNPLVALGLRRMQVDRELACDAMALSLLTPEETSAYGRTIIGQIEQLITSPPRPAIVGLCGIRARVRQRIAMIARFRKDTYGWSFLSMSLIGVLAFIGLTNALAHFETLPHWDLYARGDFPTTNQDRHANIQRMCIRHQQTGQYLAVDGETVICQSDDLGQTGLWELRFDEASNDGQGVAYLYSVTACRYLASDEEGNLTVNTTTPNESARWGTWPRPEGVWLISHNCKNGYLRLSEDSQVRAEPWGRDMQSYWDLHAVWRIKTSDDPASNPQWQREHIPGPD